MTRSAINDHRATADGGDDDDDVLMPERLGRSAGSSASAADAGGGGAAAAALVTIGVVGGARLPSPGWHAPPTEGALLAIDAIAHAVWRHLKMLTLLSLEVGWWDGGTAARRVGGWCWAVGVLVDI